ncbi:MAG: hypothetical protein HWE07_15670 [Cytophagia bacterium]|nr:hypothetical protein [Cytophagia bacterium]
MSQYDIAKEAKDASESIYRLYTESTNFSCTLYKYEPYNIGYSFQRISRLAFNFLKFDELLAIGESALRTGLENGCIKVIGWIIMGYDILKQNNHNPVDALSAYVNEHKNDRDVIDNKYAAFLLASLYYLSSFRKKYEEHRCSKEEFERKSNVAFDSLVSTIDSLDSLLISQVFFEIGMNEMTFLAAKYGQDELEDKLHAFKKANDIATSFLAANKSKSRTAKEKWAPLIREVDSLISTGKTKQNAFEIVAKRHSTKENTINWKGLKTAYSRYNK